MTHPLSEPRARNLRGPFSGHLTVFTYLTSLFVAATAPAATIPDRPEKLKFPSLVYAPPTPEKFRVPIKTGPVAYVVPDRELPLVNIVVYAHTGQYLEPAGKEGLSDLTGYLLARGGTKSKTAEGESRELPLSSRLFELLGIQRSPKGLIFTFGDESIRSVKTAWRTAVRKAGIRRVVVVDLTKPEFGLPVVRVIVPGLEPILGPGYLPGRRGQAVLEGKA